MYRILSLCLIGVLSFTFFACGGDAAEEKALEEDDNGITVTYENDDGEKETVNVDLDNINLDNVDLSEAQESLEDAMNQVAQAFGEAANDGEKVETMNFRDIKETLPGRLLGMEQTDISGEKNGAFGFSVSQAEATYEEDDRSIEVVIVDGGNIGLAKMGVAAWATVEVDKESKNGYERTTEIDGYKAFEKYDSRRDESELVWLYKDRFIITLKGEGVDGDDLRRALKRIDYDDLG